MWLSSHSRLELNKGRHVGTAEDNADNVSARATGDFNRHQSYSLTYWRVQNARRRDACTNGSGGVNIPKISTLTGLPDHSSTARDFVRDLDLQRAMIVDRVAPT